MLPLLLAIAGTTVIVLALVLGPLLKPTRAPATREAFDRAVYRDLLKELDREVARGAVAEGEAATARLELQRRLLAADDGGKTESGGAKKPVIAIGAAVLIVLVAGGIYWKVGAPGLPDDPYADRQAERAQLAQQQAQLAQIKAMVAKLADDMKQHPDDVDGWLRLGRSYAVLGQQDDATAAFAQAEKLKPNDPDVLMAEAQGLMAGHSLADPIPQPAIDLLNRIQAIVPDTPAVMWYLGLHAAQEGDFATARTDWQKVKDKMPPDSDEAKTVSAALNAIRDR